MKVSVIIPTLNEEGYIGKLLDDISSQSYKPDEIIVVDGNSDDATEHIVRGYDVTFLKSERCVGKQRTVGGSKATGDMLIFLDADVRFDRDFIKNAVNECAEKNLSIACPQYIPYPGSYMINRFYGFFNMLFRLVQKHKPSGAGSGILVRRDIFTKIGGFDESLIFDDIAFIRTAAEYGTFGILDSSIRVSDRRIRKYGLMKVALQYVWLSYLFAFKNVDQWNKVDYEFGKFGK